MKSAKVYSSADVTVTTYNACDAATKERFKSWALSLRPELDGGECGADDNGQPLPNSAYLWVVAHNATPAFVEGGLYQTFIFLDKDTGEFLATGSIVPDDREIAKTYKIAGLGFWGFANVRRDLRGRGLGKIVSSYRDKHVQQFVDRLGKPADFSMFTANPVAVKISQALGYSFVRRIFVAEFECEEDLYTKTYMPR